MHRERLLNLARPDGGSGTVAPPEETNPARKPVEMDEDHGDEAAQPATVQNEPE